MLAIGSSETELNDFLETNQYLGHGPELQGRISRSWPD